MSQPLLVSVLSELTILKSSSTQVSCLSGVQLVLFAAGLVLCCACDLSLLKGPLPSQPAVPPARDQPSAFPGPRGILGHRTFSAKTGTVPGKPGHGSPYMQHSSSHKYVYI